MTRRFEYWCPMGCGKSVMYHKSFDARKKPISHPIWQCTRCKKKFTKEQVKGV